MNPRMNIGILGGTFNPIHLGHLLLAETARDTLGLDRVVFIPTGVPPHKSSADLAPAAARLAMVRLAIHGHAAFAASDLEIRRRGPSYSIETLRRLRAHDPAASLFLIIGQDLLSVRWAAWDEITRLCTIVAARRAPVEPEIGARRRPQGAVGASAAHTASHRGTRVRWLDMPRLEIASSNIRHRVRRRRSIRYLVPDAVARYIEQYQLYRGRHGRQRMGKMRTRGATQ